MAKKHDRFERYSSPDLPFGIDREVPRCISTCPASCNVKDYIHFIARGEYDKAYDTIAETIPFPGILGRICDRPCEDECKRSLLDDPLAIKSLKRFASDNSSKMITSSEPDSEDFEETNHSVAIIGAGPAGLTAGADLRKKGYEVTIFEKEEDLGGMLRVIPEYKLPKETRENEIRELVNEFDIDLKTDCEIGKDVDIEDLKEEYEAILIATGLPGDKLIDLEGSDLDGVDTALSFLEKVELAGGEDIDLGDRTLVIGGGNTAVNSARVAHRLGTDAKVMYRRAREQMPAGERKVKEAEEEGVDFIFLASPRKILGDEKVEEVEFDLMKLGERDESGRRRPIPIRNSKISIEADHLIWAIGQEPNTQFLKDEGTTERGLIKAKPETLETEETGIFAAGDIVRGPATAVEAVGDGHRAAESIDRFLKGKDLEKGRFLPEKPQESEEFSEKMKKELMEKVSTEKISKVERKETSKIDLEERKNSFKEVKSGFSKEAAEQEAERCLSCRGCQINITTGGTEKVKDVDKTAKDLAKRTGVSKCIDCGECTGACPIAWIDEQFSPRKMVRRVLTGTEENVKDVITNGDIWKCNTCNICNSVCPYGVDFVEFIKGLREIAFKENIAPQYEESGQTFEYTDSIDRLGWVTDDLDVADEGEVYYFSGCISYLDWVYSDRKGLDLLKVPRSAVKILNSIGITPVVSEEEKCCGHDLLWKGGKEKLKELAEENIKTIKESGAKTVIFSCPEGLRTFKKDYSRIMDQDPDLEFLHLSEFLKDKELPLREEWEQEKITYHDPCRLKHLNIYDPPRDVLQKIPNVDLYEMENIKEKAPCCGVNAMSTCNPTTNQLQIQRLNEAVDTGADKLVVSCPKCWIHLDCATLTNPFAQNDLSVEEFTSFLADHIPPT